MPIIPENLLEKIEPVRYIIVPEKSPEEDNLKIITAPSPIQNQKTANVTGVPLPPSKSPSVSDEAKKNMKESQDKAKKEADDSLPTNSSAIDHPAYSLDTPYDVDELYNYETDGANTQQELVDYYDPDDVINADIGDYVQKTYTAEDRNEFLPEEYKNKDKADESGLYIKSGNKTYFYNIRDGLAGGYLRKLMTNLDKFLRINMPGVLKIGDNGVTRSLQETLEGGKHRSKSSKHGSGLAIDVTINTTKLNQATGNPIDAVNTYTYPTSNPILAKDKVLMSAIRSFLKNIEDDSGRKYEEVVKWGGDFSRNNEEDKQNGVRTMEIHHFEIKNGNFKEFFKPIEDKMIALFGKVPTKQSDLPKIYRSGLYV